MKMRNREKERAITQTAYFEYTVRDRTTTRAGAESWYHSKADSHLAQAERLGAFAIFGEPMRKREKATRYAEACRIRE
jgi:hypothetical protein